LWIADVAKGAASLFQDGVIFLALGLGFLLKKKHGGGGPKD
jgi:hypothetical protein